MNIKTLVMKYGVEEDRAEQLADAILLKIVALRYNPHAPLFSCERCGASWHDEGTESVCYNCGNLVESEVYVD